MENNIPDTTHAWNSNEKTATGLSCKELAMFLTSFSSTFRECSVISAQGGAAPTLAFLADALEGAAKNISDPSKTEDEVRMVVAGATGMAYGATAAVSESDPSALARLCSSAVSAMGELAEKQPDLFSQNEIIFRVRVSQEGGVDVSAGIATPKGPAADIIAQKAAEIAQKLGNN
jgi:hypothetical protein